MKPKTKNLIYLVVFVIGLVTSIVLTGASKDYCGPGGNCNSVTASAYASTFGVQNSTIGIFIFAVLIFLTIIQLSEPGKIKQRLINTGIIIGSIIALYFIYLQKFVLNAWCPYCLAIDISLIIALIILLIPNKK